MEAELNARTRERPTCTRGSSRIPSFAFRSGGALDDALFGVAVGRRGERVAVKRSLRVLGGSFGMDPKHRMECARSGRGSVRAAESIMTVARSRARRT